MAASSLHFSTSSLTLSTISKSKTAYSSSPSYKPNTIKASVIDHFSWSRVNIEVEAQIGRFLSGRQPASIYEPMNHLVLEVPRSMAPALCLAACEAVGGDKQKALPAASALHLMHVATYTHEYLEFSDQPTPKAMGHHVFGPKIELVSADNMIPIAYELLAGLEEEDPNSDNSDAVLQVMIEVAHALGSQGLVNGQYLKLRCLGLLSDEPFEEGLIDQALEKKGGALYSCGAACGAILGGGSEEEIEKLRRYGLYVGMIHNIMVRDVVGRDKRLMKLADSLRFLALKELEGMKDKNIERISGIMDGFSAFLRVQKYQFPNRA